MTSKITYFNLRGLAELLRLLCKYGNIPFEDIRLDQADWPKLKPTTPFGVLPLYEENGRLAFQSISIARYLAKKVKLVGATHWENLEIDSIVDTLTDLRLQLAQVFKEEDEQKKAAKQQTLVNETFPFYLERLDKIAAENNGHMAAKKLTWADFQLTVCIPMFTMFTGEEAMTKYPNLLAVKEKVENIPSIKKWIQERPVTEF